MPIKSVAAVNPKLFTVLNKHQHARKFIMTVAFKVITADAFKMSIELSWVVKTVCNDDGQ